MPMYEVRVEVRLGGTNADSGRSGRDGCRQNDNDSTRLCTYVMCNYSTDGGIEGRGRKIVEVWKADNARSASLLRDASTDE